MQTMQAIQAGTATVKGVDGADWSLKYNGKLPEYYVTAKEAIAKNWKPGKRLSDFFPEKMISIGIYKNRDGHLPQKTNRVWHEADINYKTGKRNNQRIVWSNDGLMFVTYDHYENFYEIV